MNKNLGNNGLTRASIKDYQLFLSSTDFIFLNKKVLPYRNIKEWFAPETHSTLKPYIISSAFNELNVMAYILPYKIINDQIRLVMLQSGGHTFCQDMNFTEVEL